MVLNSLICEVGGEEHTASCHVSHSGHHADIYAMQVVCYSKALLHCGLSFVSHVIGCYQSTKLIGMYADFSGPLG